VVGLIPRGGRATTRRTFYETHPYRHARGRLAVQAVHMEVPARGHLPRTALTAMIAVRIPSPSVFTLRRVLTERICHLWPVRHSRDPNKRDYAKATIRQFVGIIRQLS